jgi:hypothetical protein
MSVFTTLHLQFECVAFSTLRLNGWLAGSNLRGALGGVMQRANCLASPIERSQPAHIQSCPVCWLLAAQEVPGQERRGYAVQAPSHLQPVYHPGQPFVFGLTLFGDAQRFLPYFLLAVPEAGQQGVGLGRGQFALQSVWAVNPLTQARECLMAPRSRVVDVPTLLLDEVAVQTAVGRGDWKRTGRVTIDFITPTRLLENKRLVKIPDFGVLFARLLERIDELERQYAGGVGRPAAEVLQLRQLADRVRLIESDTEWVEAWSGSQRLGRATPVSGFVGRAVFQSIPEIWQYLIPFLYWGQLVQVGRDTVKGNGVLRVQA